MRAIIRSELFTNGVYQNRFTKDFLNEQLKEVDLPIATPTAKGFIKEYQVDGWYLVHKNIASIQGVSFEIANTFPVFVLHFELGGNCSYTPINKKTPLFEIGAFQYNLYYLPKMHGHIAYKGEPSRSLEIIFTLDRIQKIAGEDYQKILHKIDKVVQQQKPEVFWKNPKPIPQEFVSKIEKILSCTYQGALKKSYIQSKLTTILVEVLLQTNTQKPQAQHPGLAVTDIEALERVEHHLRQHLGKTLTIPALATIAGFNESKLKQIFKEHYGDTIYKYLTKRRMEKAIELIEQQGLSIAQAAYEVGYNNPQHFTKAFKRTLGYLPRVLKKLIILYEFFQLDFLYI